MSKTGIPNTQSGMVLLLCLIFLTALTLLGLSASTDTVLQNQLAANLQETERAHIAEVLEACHWKIKGAGNAAERLGLKPSTLRYRMKKLGIQRP